MHGGELPGGFRRLVNPGTPANEIDVEGTREKRELMRQDLKRREALLESLRRQEAPWTDK